MTKQRLTKRLSRSESNASALGPNAPMEIVFCFDTTGSMNSVISTVKDRVIELTERLLADIAGIRIGILAHGDYGDEPYLLQQLDLTSDAVSICDFVRNVRGTCGGDGAECYELALHEVRTSFSWSPGTRKRLVIIGDNLPHELGSARNLRKLDWRQETQALKDELRLSIYSVQAYPNSSYEHFWKALADMTSGKHLQLESMSSIFDFLMAICYREHGVEFFEAFEEEVRGRSEPCADDVSAMLVRLEEDPESESDSGSTATALARDGDDDDSSRPPTAASGDRLRGARRLPLKKRKGGVGSTTTTTTTTSRSKLSRAATAAAKATLLSAERAKRESEALRLPDALRVCGHWSRWQAIASSRPPPHGGAQQWRRFGPGWVRAKVSVSTPRPDQRVLVELRVSREDDAEERGATAQRPVLYSRILRRGTGNAVAGLLQGNGAVKWHIHRALTAGRCVQLRWARLSSDPAAPASDPAAVTSSSSSSSSSVRRQRRLLTKSNSYAWNSGRVVRAQPGGELLSVPAPRPRLMRRFLRSLDAESRMEVQEAAR